jgi:diguanylate cyclase (GGDEF)-like protein
MDDGAANGRGRLSLPPAWSAHLRHASSISRRTLLTFATASLALGVTCLVLPQLGQPHEVGIVPWWSLVVVFFAAEAYSLGIRVRSEPAALSVHDACVVFGLFVAPPVGLVFSQLIGVALASAAFQSRGGGRTIRRISSLVLTTSTAALVFYGVGGYAHSAGPAGWVAATAAVLAGALVGHLLTIVSVASGVERPSFEASRTAFGLTLGGSVASSAIALAALELVRRDDPAALLLVVPFASCALAFRAYASGRLQLVHLRELYASMRVAHGAPGLQAGVAELLESTKKLLRADVVWLALLPHGDSHYAVAKLAGDELSALAPSVLGDSEQALVRGALTAKGVVELSRRRGPAGARALMPEHALEHALATVLHGDSGPFGVLLVGNRDAEAPFGIEDVRLLETYAGHAGVLLENDRLEDSVTELTALKEQLRHQAFHDSLTGLPNRMLFTEHVARSLALDLRTAVLFLDLDDFKVINDSHGHPAGDALLVAVAERVQACVRPADVPARLGGDEFAVLADGSSTEEAERVAERLVHALSEPFFIEGHEIAAHASVGIAFGTAANTADELLRNADVAMYHAKQGGKRRYASYEPHMQEKVRRRHELASALERSVERGEIAVHYQPIVELATNRLVAVEALARWQRTGRELLPPVSFIPLADEIGLMVEIGRVVLREACAQARAWQGLFTDHGGLTVNVNLAPSELHNPTLAQEVEAVLESSGLDPSCLVLEITESGVMRHPAHALATMNALRELGVSLALDDFGTGHSSLAHLREFPLDALKIAKPFVAGLPDGHVDAAFVETIVRLARSLELGVVAEGVESAAQAQSVASLGCDCGQGFFFGAPAGRIGVTPYLTAGVLPSRPQSLHGDGIAA